MHRNLTYRYFFLSFTAAFLLLSLLFLFLMITVRPSAALPAESLSTQAQADSYLPDQEDALTVLFIGYENGATQAGTFILARFDPARDRVPVTVLPPQTMVLNSGREETLAAAYAYGGADYARTALARTLNITIDRYVAMNTSAFLAAAGTVGTVEFDLPGDLYLDNGGNGMVLSRGRQLLDGQKIHRIFTYPFYEDGELERCRLAGEITAAIVNQRMDVAKSTLADKVFERIINLIDSDISYIDYDRRRESARYLADGDAPAYSIPPSGTFSADGREFTLGDTYLVQVATGFH